MFNLAFVFCVYLEFDLATRLIGQIRTFYPLTDVLCIADGTDNREFAKLCEKEGVKYKAGQHLKYQEFGGAWLKRLLTYFLSNSNANYLIKLDPDTWIQKPFNYLPACDLAGDLFNTGVKTFIQGGCRFQTRSACEKILESNLLDESKYKLKSEFGYQRYNQFYTLPHEENSQQWYASEDRIICDVAEQLNLSISQWGEVWSKLRGTCPNPQDYAAIHPVKNHG